MPHNKSRLLQSHQSSKRRAHQKSRRGCSNCKLRRVKCDEKRPQCGSCCKAHIVCGYATDSTNLQSFHEMAITAGSFVLPRCSNNEMSLTMVNQRLSIHESNNSMNGNTYQLSMQDLDTLFRFQNRTVLSIGPPKLMTAYQAELPRLVSQTPYLMHIAMTCTTMHDRYLAGQGHSKRTPLESYHWAMASRLFNNAISNKSRSYDRDAIWLAAAFMNWIVLCAVETENPSEVWPLSPSTYSGIPWFPIQKGLRTIWEFTQPLRAGGAFAKYENGTDPGNRCLGLPPPRSGIEGIPQTLVDMCELDQWSSAQNNPYHTAARSLSDLLEMSETHCSSLRFLSFVNTTEPDFEILLKERDPRALVLMAIWYGLVPKSTWWISLRASLERRAVCIYLDRYHAYDLFVQTAFNSFLVV